MQMEETEIEGFRIKMFSFNDLLIGIPTEIGPRILYFASKERPEFNMFRILPEAGAPTSEGFWHIYGGHRLWSSPEAKPRSYSMDNQPVQITVNGENVEIHGRPEHANSTQKIISVKPLGKNEVCVTHSIRNIGRWPIKFACWALSIMRKNGFAIIPLQPSKVDEEGLLPDRRVTFWPYSQLSDPRLKLTDGYIFVRQDPKMPNPFKIGAMANPSWTAYWADGIAFVKRFTQEQGEYPDFGCNVETYTNSEILELETLGALKTVEPGETIRHTEIWSLLNVGDLAPESQSVKEKLEPLMQGQA